MGESTPGFADIAGSAPVMRRLLSLLERAAATEVTILLEGETGTGKGALADAVHRASPRRHRPLVVVDCGAIPTGLIEAELFGHERGSFTGADRLRIGAFEEADGGTLFLDEIGELPLDVQPKLLRAIESRTIRRIGSNQHRPIDVRLIAATCRRLGDDARAGRFRVDLFHRLAVAHLVVPPLRERREDIPAIAARLLERLGVAPERVAALLDGDHLAALMAMPWLGNVRELRNALERLLVFGELAEALPALGALEPGRTHAATYAEARRRALDAFERDYLGDLLRRHGGNVAAVAAAAGLHRVHVFRLIRRHRLREPAPPTTVTAAATR
ncbi:MAG TPA: sigma-54 dependent transcriptional regulator [Kofleriaceae bacterium]|jgi:DNA-binding NtrC family response regulator|nr:sigma-54 dependent transcriptional regulator [Kofleriaceae bacterium]